ncbi:MAG TPA: hypothetical protein VLA16_01765 [Ideonella sp.]|nr:hypothetical protein [Ideonella sp.]
MNRPASPPTSTPAALRRHRAQVATQLLAEAPQVAAALDWAALGQAPDWMALAGDARQLFVRRVGSVMLAPALRLWIAATPVAAARAALGASWWRQLLQRDGWPAMPAQAAAWPADTALDEAGVSGLLHGAGAAVLLATLPHGALRHAASQWLAPVAALLMPAPAAHTLLALAVQMHIEDGPPEAAAAEATQAGGAA